jgi:hypothetical protein
MHGARHHQTDVQAVLNGFEPLLHEQVADLQASIIRMDGKTTELSDEIRMGAKSKRTDAVPTTRPDSSSSATR